MSLLTRQASISLKMSLWQAVVEHWSCCAIWSPALTEGLCSKKDICLAWCSRLCYTVNPPSIVSACVCFCQCVYVQICAPVYKYVRVTWCVSELCVLCAFKSENNKHSQTVILHKRPASFFSFSPGDKVLFCRSASNKPRPQPPNPAPGGGCMCVASAWQKPIP